MLMSDASIGALLRSGELEIDPLGDGAIQPCSVDLRLHDEFMLFHESTEPIDPKVRIAHQMTTHRVRDSGHLVIMPGEFILGATLERTRCSAGYALTFTGKSSLARLGLTVHKTAGHIDPGFNGRITLEISNANSRPILLWPGMWIGQVLVTPLDRPAERPYGSPDLMSRYQNQSTVTASRGWI